MTLLADKPLFGPSAEELFDPVPREDYVASLTDGIGDLVGDIEWETRNVVLTLARMWASIETDEVISKDAAAEWALKRLPVRLHLDAPGSARSMYLGDRDNWSRDPIPAAHAYADHVIREIMLASRRT